MEAFMGKLPLPRSPRPDVGVARRRNPRPQERGVYTVCRCPALRGLLKNHHCCRESGRQGEQSWTVGPVRKGPTPWFISTYSHLRPLRKFTHGVPLGFMLTLCPDAHRSPSIMPDIVQIKKTCFFEEML